MTVKLMRKPIEVIAWFDFEGNAVPIRFRYEDESRELRVVKINRIIKKDKNNFAGNSMMRYTCETSDNGVIKVFELRYDIDSLRWYLHKM